MIVDDNRDAADALALLLTFEGHHVDVVFLDIGKPVTDGYGVARATRANHSNPPDCSPSLATGCPRTVNAQLQPDLMHI